MNNEFGYTPRRDQRAKVQALRPFRGSNIYAETRPDGLYVVYSYGEHWPLWVFDPVALQWFGSRERCSVTTSCHKSATAPVAPHLVTWLDCETMLELVRAGGLVGWVARRVAG